MCEWFNAFLGIAAFDGSAGIPDGVSDFDRTRGFEVYENFDAGDGDVYDAFSGLLLLFSGLWECFAGFHGFDAIDVDSGLDGFSALFWLQ